MTNRLRRQLVRTTCVSIAAAIAAGLCAPAALALPEPKVVGGAPGEGPVSPPEATQQSVVCATPANDGTDFTVMPKTLAALGIDRAWQFSRGAGQRVAVIDTGVTPQPRLRVIPGGDYVSTGDGTSDCDGHGTQVAGIIAGRPSGADAFSGIAPEASIIAIRQSSQSFRAKNSTDADAAGKTSSGYGSTTTMARAIVRAVNLHATVINISEVACVPAGQAPGPASDLGRAVRYAHSRNVVVVVAAGNVSDKSGCKPQNPLHNATDPANRWGNVTTVATPAWYSDYVLAVGSVESDGSVSSYSLAGPWVGVAAPGSDVVSLSSLRGRNELVNGERAEGKFIPLRGTSFSAAYVSGLAALIRDRFPDATADQVRQRIIATAHGSGHRDRSIGYGVIDPVAALTAQLPTAAMDSDPATGHVAAPAPEAPASMTPWIIAGAGLLGGGIVVAAICLAIRPARDRRKLVEGVDY